jgi:cytochrome b561
MEQETVEIMAMNETSAGSSAARYTRTAVALHWLIAGLIACGFTLGMVMTDLAASPQKLRLYSYHKWIGITVLGLAALRGLWRLTHAAPALLPMPQWQAIAAKFTHAFLYVLMFAIPLTGWAFSSASGYQVVYLGRFPLPNLVAKNKALAESLTEVHETLAWLMLGIVVVHVAAALKHHFVDRDDTLRRMLRWARS